MVQPKIAGSHGPVAPQLSVKWKSLKWKNLLKATSTLCSTPMLLLSMIIPTISQAGAEQYQTQIL